MNKDKTLRSIKDCPRGCPFLKQINVPSFEKGHQEDRKFCAHILISGIPRPETCDLSKLKVEFKSLNPKTQKIWGRSKQ